MSRLTDADDLRHTLRDHPHSRESLFYGIPLVDEGLLIFFYTWVGSDHRAGYLFGVMEDDDVRLAFAAGDGIDAHGADFDDWALEGLRVRHSVPLAEAELSFSGDGVNFEATFHGLHEAFSYHDSEDGCPAFIADDRFEQAGRVTGTLTIGDRQVTIDTTGQRDHSWGTRDWDVLQDWKWLHVHEPGGDAAHVLLLHGRGETTTHGYVVRAGTLYPVTRARIRAEYDANFFQTSAVAELVDAGGVTTVCTVERVAFLRFEAGEKIVMHEAACRATIAGRAANGHLECGWYREYAALQANRQAAALSG